MIFLIVMIAVVLVLASLWRSTLIAQRRAQVRMDRAEARRTRQRTENEQVAEGYGWIADQVARKYQ